MLGIVHTYCSNLPRFKLETNNVGFFYRKEGRKCFISHLILLLYSVGHVVKDHSDSKRGNPLLSLHGLLFLFSNTDRIAPTTAFATPIVEH